LEGRNAVSGRNFSYLRALTRELSICLVACFGMSGRWGMLVVETVGRIRREHFVQGESIKEIAAREEHGWIMDCALLKNQAERRLRALRAWVSSAPERLTRSV
jgi:hypothetical protein